MALACKLTIGTAVRGGVHYKDLYLSSFAAVKRQARNGVDNFNRDCHLIANVP